MNDASMFKTCTHSIAMGNAAEELKNMAEYITDDIDHDGIVSALKYFGIIE